MMLIVIFSVLLHFTDLLT